MNRYMVALLAGLAAVGMLSSSALAQRAAATSRPERPEARSRPAREGVELMERLIKELNLTADQRTRVEQIVRTQQQALAAWRQENQPQIKAIEEKLKEARQNKDPEALKAAREQLMAIQESRKELAQNFEKQLSEVLTKEQMDKAREILAEVARPVNEALTSLESLNLDDAQKAKVKEILDQARQDAEKAPDAKAKMEILQAAFEKIKKDVLTDEQRKKLQSVGQEPTIFARIERLNLTDDQRAKMKAIVQDARDNATKAQTPREKMEIWQAAHKKIVDEVLTDDQRKQLQQERPEGPRPHTRAASKPAP